MVTYFAMPGIPGMAGIFDPLFGFPVAAPGASLIEEDEEEEEEEGVVAAFVTRPSHTVLT